MSSNHGFARVQHKKTNCVGNEIGGSHLTDFLSSKIHHVRLKWLVTWNCFSSLAVGPNTPTSTCIYFFRTTGQRKEKQSNNEKIVETIQGYQTDCSKSNVNAMKCMEKINKACCVVGVPAGIFCHVFHKPHMVLQITFVAMICHLFCAPIETSCISVQIQNAYIRIRLH